jgi:hypothetical protein
LYSDYPKTEFHFINDNADGWLQMDKLFLPSNRQVRGGNAEWSGAQKRDNYSWFRLRIF